MALGTAVLNAVWYAFDSLDSYGTGRVPKSKLKVLTANLGTVMNIVNVDKGLQDHKSTAYLAFEDYIFYLRAELFSQCEKDLTRVRLLSSQVQIEDVCWLVCKHKFITRENAYFSDANVFKLFRIFCALAEEVDPNNIKYRKHVSHDFARTTIELDVKEFRFLTDAFVAALGREWDVKIFQDSVTGMDWIQFEALICFWEAWFVQGMDPSGLQEALDEIYEVYVEDVMKKGILYRRGGKLFLAPWKEGWFVLQPGGLAMYTQRCKKERKGDIILGSESSVQAVSDSPSNPRPCRFTVTSAEKKWELSATDHKTRQQWVTAIETAILNSESLVTYQRQLTNQRRVERHDEEKKIRREEAEKIEQQIKLENQQAELDAERLARTAAEMQAKEEAAQLDLERQRRLELEIAGKELEKLLEQERQAKRDEEIVRTLQARVLREEWEKREELEHLQDEQKKLLDNERHLRVNLENKSIERDQQLSDAYLELENLQEERKRLDLQLKDAWKMAVEAEKAKDMLQRRFQDMQANSQMNEQAKILLETKLKGRDRSMIPLPVSNKCNALANDSSPTGKKVPSAIVVAQSSTGSDYSDEDEEEEEVDDGI